MPHNHLGKIIRQILSYPKTTSKTYVNAFLQGQTLQYVTRHEMMQHIKATVNSMSGLGFKGSDVGTHSIRSSLAMALNLNKRMISTIMLIGCWSSDAFLLYIRRQVQEFSAGVSADMVSTNKFFYNPGYRDTGPTRSPYKQLSVICIIDLFEWPGSCDCSCQTACSACLALGSLGVLAFRLWA